MAFSLNDFEQAAAPQLSMQPVQPLSNDLVSGMVNFRQRLAAAPRPAPGLVTSGQSVTAMPGLDPNVAADMQRRADEALGNEQTTNNQLAANAEKREDDKSVQLQAREDLAATQQHSEEERAKQVKANADAEVSRLVKEDEEAKVDPDRFVDEMSTGKQIGMVLLAGLSGAFRAASGGNGSGFLDSIEKRIEQDIRAQEEQVRSGRIRRGNQIAAAMNRGANAEQAQALARLRAYEAAQNKLTLQANRMGTNGVHTDNAAALNAQLETKKADSQNRLLEATQTKYQTSTSYARPAAAKPASLEDIKKQQEIKQNQLEEMDANEIARIVSTPDADGKQRPVSIKRATQAVKDAQELATKVPRYDVAEKQLGDVLEAAGVPRDAYDTKTGVIDWNKAPKDIKGVGPLDSRPAVKAGLYSGPFAPVVGGVTAASNAVGVTRPETNNVQDAAAALQESITYATTGAVASPTQVETFRKQAGGDVSNEQAFKENLTRYATQLFTHRNALLSGNEDARKLYEHNQGATRQQTPSLKPGVN